MLVRAPFWGGKEIPRALGLFPPGGVTPFLIPLFWKGRNGGPFFPNLSTGENPNPGGFPLLIRTPGTFSRASFGSGNFWGLWAFQEKVEKRLKVLLRPFLTSLPYMGGMFPKPIFFEF